jgi:hypothetical protein
VGLVQKGWLVWHSITVTASNNALYASNEYGCMRTTSNHGYFNNLQERLQKWLPAPAIRAHHQKRTEPLRIIEDQL